jgi:hypothetical protein
MPGPVTNFELKIVGTMRLMPAFNSLVVSRAIADRTARGLECPADCSLGSLNRIYEELGQVAQNPEIKDALDAQELVSSQIVNRLDECFRLIGEKPAKVNQQLHEVFIEDFRRELNEPSPANSSSWPRPATWRTCR